MIGQIIAFAGTVLPSNKYKHCDGATLKKSLYPHLFNVIGYTYGGSGDDFKLPDLRGRIAVGCGDATSTLGCSLNIGDKGGVKSNTLTVANMPAHTHNITGSVTVGVNDNSPDIEEAGGNVLGKTNADDVVYNEQGVTGVLGGVSHNLTCSSVGNSLANPLTNLQPYLTVAAIIRVQ